MQLQSFQQNYTNDSKSEVLRTLSVTAYAPRQQLTYFVNHYNSFM